MENKIIIFVLCSVLCCFCGKFTLEPKAFVITENIIISGTTVIAEGRITGIGDKILQHGHVWSEAPLPTIEDNKTTLGEATETGSFNSQLLGLEPSTTYFVRSYATDGYGTFYGEDKQITTGAVSLVMDSVTILNTTTIKAFANLLAVGPNPIIQHGFCWSPTSLFPSIEVDNFNELGDLNSVSEFNDELLIHPDTGFIRAYIKTDQKIVYSNAISFVIENPVITGGVQIYSPNRITATGQIENIDDLQILEYGHCWSKVNALPTINDTKVLGEGLMQGNFRSTFSGLITETTYYYRTYVKTSEIIIYGETKSFYIKEPTLLINDFIPQGAMTALVKGSITLGDYNVTKHGFCWSNTNQLPTINDDIIDLGGTNNSINFSDILTGLIIDIPYYIRGYSIAENVVTYSPVFIDSIKNYWTQKANFGGIARENAVGFSLNNKGYIGTGKGTGINNYKKDFWEYDPSIDVWTQKADFGGIARENAIGFSLNNKGYIGTGKGNGSNNYKRDFWEYDPSIDVWVQKANLGGIARGNAVGFSLNGKGYVGTGSNDNYRKDFWEYNPTNDTWVQKANFGGTARENAVGFSLNGKGYIGVGYDGNYKKDIWEYNPTNDTWVQKADFGGTARGNAVGFSLYGAGYIGIGTDGVSYKKDIWEYNPTNDNWIQKADFGGTARINSVGFSINGRGYIGTGRSAGTYFNDFWEYIIN